MFKALAKIFTLNKPLRRNTGVQGVLMCGEERKEIKGKVGKGAPGMTPPEMRIKHMVGT
jgi:hypothetical protein